MFDEKSRMRKNSPTRGASDDGEGKRPDYRKQMYEVKRHLEAMNGRDVAGTENLGNFLRNDGKARCCDGSKTKQPQSRVSLLCGAFLLLLLPLLRRAFIALYYPPHACDGKKG